jgi:hypothetical protein
MEEIADLPRVVPPWADLDPLFDLGDGRQIEVLPASLGEEMTGDRRRAVSA